MAKTVYGEILRLPSIVALWRFNNNSNDEINGYNGVDSNVVFNAGKFNKYITFNGVNANTQIGDISDLKTTNDFTYGFWFKSLGGGGTIYAPIQSGSPGGGVPLGGVWIEPFTAGDGIERIFMFTSSGAGYLGIGAGGGVQCDNKWHFWVGTYRSADTTKFVVSVDGRRTGFSNLPVPTFPATINGFIIGSYDRGDYFTGDVEEFFVLNGYGMSLGEIKRLYLQSVGKFS